MKLDRAGNLSETKYRIDREAQHASLFTTGNGYIGVRGSFEEFASVRIQGAYIRGYIGEIIEVMEPFPDNEYMKNYYIDEEELKNFEKQESVINLPDFLLIRFFVGEKPFYPWQGKIRRWSRFLDTHTGVLSRSVEWDDGAGNVTRFRFERFASYADKHRYVIKASAHAVGHNLPITVWSGIDKRAKTGGQFVTRQLCESHWNDTILYESEIDNTYCFGLSLGVRSKISSAAGGLEIGLLSEGGLICHTATATGEVSVEKLACFYTEREENRQECTRNVKQTLAVFEGYTAEFERHMAVYRRLFDKIDVSIYDDPEADGCLRFVNYHTMISADDDRIHSISAKGLTGEKYNGFVWWDCEIYQLPVFIYTDPSRAKQALLYRYDRLARSKINAAEAGAAGAKYAFCSSVTGKECVWKYARHPFMQIHINADIAYAVIEYFRATGDVSFMEEYGAEMLCELARYWMSRVEKRGCRYEITRVTGPDEHHPYVNNDAYTNYLVHFVLKKTAEYQTRFAVNKSFALTAEELAKIADISDNLYLPMRDDGLIPQFDGYFELSPGLVKADGSSAKNFQMKQSGLYHKSQIIKQPDVMLLFNYIDLDGYFPAHAYSVNWAYYEQKCEHASSLSYPCHAMCAADNGQAEKFRHYFMQTLKIDIDDLQGCAWQGVHSGCYAGGWLSVLHAVFGIALREKGICITPSISVWKKVCFNFEYRGVRIRAEKTMHSIVLQKQSSVEVPVLYCGKKCAWSGDILTVALFEDKQNSMLRKV